tara:strand:- start:488 stop:1846 length:1359 start_codon:yes stop_codon:yes gene_type:complete
MKNIFFLFFALFFSISISSQYATVDDVKKMADKMNESSGFKDPRTGLEMTGVTSAGKTIIISYEVPQDWYPMDNMKQILIENFQKTSVSETYFKYRINWNAKYYKGARLVKNININYDEFNNKYDLLGNLISSTISSYEGYKLGDYVSFKDHPKSKGANFKIKKPLNMELKEGDRPNIVTKFNQKNDNAVYLIQTTQLPNYNAKQYFEEIFIDNEAVKEWSLEYLDPMKSSYSANYISSEATTVDTYPTIQIIYDMKKSVLGKELKMKGIIWVVFHEDLMISFQGMTQQENFEKLMPIFYKITLSITFPDQYSSTYNPKNENFDMYVDKFYRELEVLGIFPVRPSNISIKLKDLDSRENTTHLHGYSLGYNDDDKIEIVINRRTWETSNKAIKHYLIFHELAHDVLNLDDLSPNISNKGMIMYPGISKYEGLNMDDLIINFHSLIENYSSNN